MCAWSVVQVQLCFQPREAGTFSQHWELKTEAHGIPVTITQSAKYELLAEVSRSALLAEVSRSALLYSLDAHLCNV